MQILKWICFVIVCIDVIAYILDFGNGKREINGASTIFGMLIGVAARVFVLYGAATCWLLG